MSSQDILRRFQNQQSLYEDMVTSLIRKVPVSGIFIDCGAHMGMHTENMLGRDDVTTIVAIEAIPHLVQRLRDKFHNDSRVHIIPSAIGGSAGSIEFNVASDAMGYSGIKRRDIASVTRWETLHIPLVTLDHIVDGLDGDKTVGLIKLDLEGGEYDALLGGIQILSNHRPFVVFENGLAKSADIYGYGRNDFFSLFDLVGYCVYDFFGNRVDNAYWERPLFTYMFVALPNDSPLLNWYLNEREEIIFSIAHMQ